MEIEINLIEKALKKSAEKGQLTYDRFGLEKLRDKINEELPDDFKQLGKRYLYDTVFLAIQNGKKKESRKVSLNRSCLDSIVYYLGYKDIDHYRQAQVPMISKEIFPIEGNWYSVVRCNSGLPQLLLSPVRIMANNNNVPTIELRGPHRHYSGNINWAGGCINSLLTSNDNIKSIHLCFKIGLSKKPKIILGVFSGISSGGDPIAGKEILMKSEEEFSAMQNYIIPLSDEPSAKYSWIPKPIFKYFEDYNKCYFKIGHASTFDLNDL